MSPSRPHRLWHRHPVAFTALCVQRLQWYRVVLPPAPGAVRLQPIERPPGAQPVPLYMHPN